MFSYKAKELCCDAGGDGPRERRVEPDDVPLSPALLLLFIFVVSLLVIGFVILYTVVVAAGSQCVVIERRCVFENLLV